MRATEPALPCDDLGRDARSRRRRHSEREGAMSVAIIAKKDCDVKDIISRSPVRALPDAEKILRKWLRTSDDVWVGMHDDQVACVWGLSSPTTISNKAYLWLLTTDLVDKHKF